MIVVSNDVVQSEKGRVLTGDLLDEPDPRLVGALNSVHDRPFVLKLEQEVTVFITENRCVRLLKLRI